jgi:hypothetical protein
MIFCWNILGDILLEYFLGLSSSSIFVVDHQTKQQRFTDSKHILVGFCSGISQHDPQNRSVAAYVAKESRKDAQDYFPTEIAYKIGGTNKT